MRLRSLLPLLLTSTLLVGASACDGDDGDNGTETQEATLTLTTSGLEPLGGGYVYEGWIIVDGAALTTGRFNVEEGTDSYSFTIDAADADAASAFVLTIEPGAGDDPAPSVVHVLAGDLSGGSAQLTMGHAAALGTDFADAAGSFILETPTSGMVMDDYNQGIWWLQMGANGPEPSLTLPELPAGWVYEGWVVGEDGPISTGRFTDAMMADDDGAGSTAGPDGSPPFPGQDFIDPASVLTGYMAVISVEPEEDDSPAPFAIKPLVDSDIEDLGAGTPQEMANMAAGGPSGEVTIQ